MIDMTAEHVRTPHLIANEAVDAMLTELNSASTVRDFLVGLMETTLYLGMKPEWDMEDNFQTTEGLVSDLSEYLPELTAAEVRRAADEWDLDAECLDEPYAETVEEN